MNLKIFSIMSFISLASSPYVFCMESNVPSGQAIDSNLFVIFNNPQLFTLPIFHSFTQNLSKLIEQQLPRFTNDELLRFERQLRICQTEFLAVIPENQQDTHWRDMLHQCMETIKKQKEARGLYRNRALMLLSSPTLILSIVAAGALVTYSIYCWQQKKKKKKIINQN